jgi:hypothetical protein
MLLPILAMIVIFFILWMILRLFFPSIKGLLRLIVPLLLTIFVMQLLASWFGLFADFVFDNRVWWVVGVLILLAVLYFLFTLQGTARRIFLFVLSLFGGFYLATLMVRWFGVGSSMNNNLPTEETDNIVVDT